jgi:putative Ca2+/H+ antiporter (TMEM165/GDT1 family)
MGAALSAFGLVFLAEVGDKSMLIAFSLGARFPWWLVFAALALTIAGLMALAVGLGSAASAALPADVVGVGAAGLFLIFGVWTWLSAPAPEAEEAEGARPQTSRSGLLMLAAFMGTFALAELGDKTQVAALSLSGLSAEDVFGVWAGAVLGMLLADGIALVVGIRAARMIPARLLARGAAVVFVAAGLGTLGFTLVR